MKKIYRIIATLVIFFTIILTAGCVKDSVEVEVLKKFKKDELIQYQSGDNINNVTKDIKVITEISGYPIYWNSDNEAITFTGEVGVVTRTGLEVEVNLIATIKIDSERSGSREYKLTIPKNQEETNFYSVKIDLAGGILPEGTPSSYFVNAGERFNEPVNPIKEGYTFIEWRLNGVKYDFTSPVNKNITLVAHYENNNVETKYTVTLDPNGGSLPTGSPVTQEVLEGSLFNNPGNPTKEGYTFIEWRLNGVKYDFNTPITGNITLIAHYESNAPQTKYIITLDVNGGTLPAGTPITYEVTEGAVFNNPGTPTRNGYTFIEWRLNGVKYNFATPVTGNITLVAEYSINEPGNYKLTLPSGVTSDAVNPNSIPAGTDITLTVSEVAGKDVVVFVNGVYRKQDTAGLIEVEVLSNVTVETRLVDKTTPLFDIRKLSDVEVNFMGIITGIIPDGKGNYIYVNDETAAIIYYSAISPQLKVGDLLHVKGGFVTTLYNNKVIYPQAQGIETILKSNQPLPPAVYAQDVSHGTLDYQGLSLQAQRFNIENLSVVEKPLEGKSKNFLVED